MVAGGDCSCSIFACNACAAFAADAARARSTHESFLFFAACSANKRPLSPNSLLTLFSSAEGSFMPKSRVLAWGNVISAISSGLRIPGEVNISFFRRLSLSGNPLGFGVCCCHT